MPFLPRNQIGTVEAASSRLLPGGTVTVIGIATIEGTIEVRGVSAIVKGERVETVRGENHTFGEGILFKNDHVLTQGVFL